MVTFGEIKELTKDIIIPKKVLDDNYVLNYEELISNKIFPLFRWNENPLLVINGIKINEKKELTKNDITVYYQELEKVKIIPSAYDIDVSGGTINLKSEATYSLYSYNIFNGKNIESTYNGSIKPVYHIIYQDFAKLSSEKVFFLENKTTKARTAEISIFYRDNKIVKKDNIIIKQGINTISDWALDKEIINNLSLSCDSDNILDTSEKVINFKVIKDGVREYCKKDSFGNKLENILKENFSEDITSSCKFELDDRKCTFVKVLGNHAVVSQQEIGDSERSFSVSTTINDVVLTKQFTQKSGGELSYENILRFGNGTNIDIINLPDNSICDGYIPIEYFCNVYANGAFAKKIYYKPQDLYFILKNKKVREFQNSWCKASLVQDNNNLLVYVEILSKNPSKNEERQIEIEIEGAEKTIYLTIIQPKLKLIREETTLRIDGQEIYDKETITEASLKFIPIVIYTYEDGSYQELEYLDDKYEIIESMESHIDGIDSYNVSINDLNKEKILTFNVDKAKLPTVGDYSIDIVGKIINKNTQTQITKSLFKITLHNKEIVYNAYYFHNEGKKYIWKKDNLEKILIPITSALYENKNDNLSYELAKNNTNSKYIGNIDYNIITDNDVSDIFNIEKVEEGLEISPINLNKTNKSIEKTIKIVQNNSNKGINITLIQECEAIKQIPLNIKVIVETENIEKETWSTESSLYIIDENGETKYSLPLNPCWLDKSMEKCQDIIYNGNVLLNVNNTYHFLTRGFQIIQPSNLSDNNYNINEAFYINVNTNEKTFVIKL